MNETSNWASRKYEEPSTDPNFLSDSSIHEDPTISRFKNSRINKIYNVSIVQSKLKLDGDLAQLNAE